MQDDRQYELVYIVTPTATEAELAVLETEVGELIQKLGGTVRNTEVWGRRKLAYEVEHHTEGIYVVLLIDGPGEMIKEVERRLRVRDQVLRHLIVRVDEDLRKVRRATEKRKATTQRRRAARGKPPLPVEPAAPAAPAADAGTAAAKETSEVQA